MDQDNKGIWSERWRLAALSQEELIRLGLVSLMLGLIYLIFNFQGNTTNVDFYTRSALTWMARRWNDGGDFSHGWLIPFVSIFVVWYKRRELAAATKNVSRVGLTILIIGLLLHWVGAKAQQTRLSLFGLIVILWGMPFYFYGWQVAKTLIFPASYLIFCIPLNFLDSITFPLRIFVTVVSVSILNGLGIAVIRTGSAIRSATGLFELDVADPCSGLRSLLAMTALTAVYAFLTQKTLLKKWILFLASIPLAIIGNMARITTIGLMAQAFGQKFATGLYHDYSGYIVFSVAIGLMVGLGGFLNMNLRETWKKWKLKLLDPTS